MFVHCGMLDRYVIRRIQFIRTYLQMKSLFLQLLKLGYLKIAYFTQILRSLVIITTLVTIVPLGVAALEFSISTLSELS